LRKYGTLWKGRLRKKISGVIEMSKISERLDHCQDFGDVFELVKKSAETSLGRRRAGLMLYLAKLPNHIGAFHTIGTNGIVMNRTALDAITRGAHSLREINSYVYSILLHEYLHALGYAEEREVRRLVYDVTLDTFGPEHPATKIASEGPSAILPAPSVDDSPNRSPDVEVVPDLEKSSQRYIS
jgi:hypothetical protein